ncbi:hypothetical protein CHS0354_021951 [Potamilus streckersoni]|uniref:C1q domain-containing protein n=1 Tax=Potamilus streckersoni TaxID=2493646 RepID=A0AAE0SK31_9BIVA|nr:hypothetical protein CHS0354_021951 [Potamilus streckersoni]
MYLLTEEKQLRAQLNTELQIAKNRLDQLEQNNECSCSQKTFSAFWVGLDGTINTLGEYQRILFNRIKLNIGNGWQAAHGIFRAPSTGTYQFSLDVQSDGGATELAIYHNGVMLKRAFNDHNMYISVIVNLTAGDEVWVNHVANFGHAIIGDDWTNFSGHLLHAV